MPKHTPAEKRKNRLSLLRKEKEKNKPKTNTGHNTGHKK